MTNVYSSAEGTLSEPYLVRGSWINLPIQASLPFLSNLRERARENKVNRGRVFKKYIRNLAAEERSRGQSGKELNHGRTIS